MSNSRFTPVRGLEEQILNYPYKDGYSYYAIDTGKIYLDAEGVRIPMGGAGAAIYYANATGVQQDEETTYYPIPADSLDNQNASLKVDDLILNIDGAFYKVIEIYDNEFWCDRLAVSGTGGGGGGEGQSKKISISVEALETSNLINGQSAIVYFTANSAIDIDGSQMDDKLTVTWTLLEKSGQNYTTYGTGVIDVVSGERNSFDFGSRLRESTTTRIEFVANGINSGASAKRYLEVSTSNLTLSYTSTFSNSTTYSPDKVTLQCNAIGQMAKILEFYFDDSLVESRELPSNAQNLQTLNISSELATHGAHKVKICLYQSINGKKGLSVPSLDFEIAVVSPISNMPVLWLGNYQEKYYNYDSIQIPFLVYDPENTVEATVHLYKNQIELDSSPRQVTDFSKFNIFEISDADMDQINYYQLSCGEGTRKVEREISFTVEQDPNRSMEIVKQDYLKLNFDPKGRSNNESETNRKNWSSGNIKASFDNFNWYNNGWKMDDETKSTFLRISNGAKFTIPLGPMTFADNNATKQSNSIEFQFKIRNIQEYSNLIKNITRYKDDGELYAAFKNPNINPNYTNYDSFLHWYLSTYPEKGDYDSLQFDRVQKEISLDKAVCSYYSGDESSVIGLCLGPQDAFFSNGANTVNVSYVEDDMVYLSMVYSHSLKMMYIYINGVVTGVTKSTLSSPFTIGSNEMIFNSEFCDIDLYKIRVYNTDLNVNDIVTNHSVDIKDVVTYDQNRLAEENNKIKEYQFIYQNMINYNEEHPDAPIMPYIIFDTTDSGTNDKLSYSKAIKFPISVTFVNTGLERAYESGELETLAIEDGLCTASSSAEEKAEAVKIYYQHHCPSFVGNNVEMAVQGTSSEFYPRRNYKIKTKTKYDSDGEERIHIFLNKGPFANDYTNDIESTRQEYWYMNNYTNGTNKWTMKVDFMESSGSYNAGFANLVGNAYSKHPLQDYLDSGAISDPNGLLQSSILNTMKWEDYRTSIQGYPVLAFHKKSDGTYHFIGMYRMLLDKGSDEVYGFKTPKKLVHNIIKDADGEGVRVRDIAECWEFSNNARGYCSYRDPWNRVELDFIAPSSATNGTTAAGAPVMVDSFEYRYTAHEDALDILYNLDNESDTDKQAIYDEYGVANANELTKKIYHNWENLVKWVWSTNTDNVVSEGTYVEAPVGNELYVPNRYYIMLAEGGFDLCGDIEWSQDQIYYTRKSNVDIDGNTTYTYTVANVTNSDYLYEANKFYQKIDEKTYSLYADATFNPDYIYYELIVDESYRDKADLLVKVCNDPTYDSSKQYYNYDGSVTVGTKAVTEVDAATAQANYAPGKYYVASPVTYGPHTYTHDTKEYRADKFINEVSKHFDVEYLATYFMMTEVFECYDSRGKNCMVASWGPQEEGGEYIWYPIFYDIDTQLGINNTGIPSFEFNVDATDNENFSTSDSLLWNNFYKYFKRSYILMKYKHLKGITQNVSWPALKNPPLQSVDYIEKWYRFDPSVTNSIMCRGEKPLIATNLDEYYKYITITNSLAVSDGTTGYLDRNGSYVYDSNGTYFYALQGDRSQSRRQFLTNRLEYIDSWLSQGNYARGGTNCVRGRVSANSVENGATSDKWIETFDEPYYKEDGTKSHQFDAEYWINLKPIRSSYVTLGDDNEAYPSKKYDGLTPVKFNIDAIENAVRTSPEFNEQLLYVYGLNQMSDLGDISNLYWKEFYLEGGGAPKLTSLKLGYDGLDDEGNKWFNKAMNKPLIPAGKDSLIGMPLLKEMNISNITFNAGSESMTLDLSSCEKLENFRATGTNCVSFDFAEGVALNTLYLPSSATSLKLIEANLLTDLITEYNNPIKNSSGNLEAIPGLYLEGLFEEGGVSALRTINLVGGALGYNSYKILTKYYEKNPSGGAITMTKVKWCPYVQLVEGDTYIEADADKYYVDNGHYGFEPYIYNASTFNTQLINGELYKKDNTTDEVINQINDSGLAMLEDFITNDSFTGEPASLPVPNITGIIFINNTTEIDEGYIRNTLQNAYPGLTFFFTNVKKAYSAKFVMMNDETGGYEYVPFADGDTTMRSVQKVSQEEYTNGKTWFDNPYELYSPKKTHWNFFGWSTSPRKEDIISEEEWDNQTFIVDQYDYTFYAIFEIVSYTFNFLCNTNGDGVTYDTVYSEEVPYGSRVTYSRLDKIVPYKSDLKLPLTSTYKFIGYALSETGIPINVQTYTSRKNQTFYAIFEEISVYDNVLDNKYLKFEEIKVGNTTGYSIGLDREYKIKGKITLPISYNNKPILAISQGKQTINDLSIKDNGFNFNTNITHIFWADKGINSTIKSIESDAFKEDYNLIYFEIPDSLLNIGDRSFNKCCLSNNIWAGKIQSIGVSAFDNGLALPEKAQLILGGSITTLGESAFAYIGSGDLSSVQRPLSTVIIGSIEDKSQLNYISGTGGVFFQSDYVSKISKITIYASNPSDPFWANIGDKFGLREETTVEIL